MDEKKKGKGSGMKKPSRVVENPDGTFSCRLCPSDKLKPFKARRSVYSHWTAKHAPKKKEVKTGRKIKAKYTKKEPKTKMPAAWMPFFANHCMNCGHAIPKKVMF